MSFPKVVSQSGLTKPELATLYGVSRQTIFLWRRDGLPKPGFTVAGRAVETITKALMNAIKSKILPFGPVSKAVRARRVAQMAVTLQALKIK